MELKEIEYERENGMSHKKRMKKLLSCYAKN